MTSSDERFIMPPMDALWFDIVTAMAAAALVGGSLHWRHRGQLGQVMRKLAEAESATKAAVERSAQARVQVMHLSQALAEATRARKSLEAAQRRRDEIESALAAPPPAVDTRHTDFASTTPGLPPQGFADTLPMQ